MINVVHLLGQNCMELRWAVLVRLRITVTDDIITEALASTFQSISYHLFAYDSCLKLPCLINPYTHKATHPRYEPTGAFFSRQNNERAYVPRNFKSNVVLDNSLFTEENYSHGS